MKIMLPVILLLITVCANAQIKKGATFIGGDLSAYYYEAKNLDSNHVGWKSATYNFNPSIGRAVKDNLIVGVRLAGSFFHNLTYDVFVDDKGYSVGAGIWLRKYQSIGKSFYLFVDAGLNGQSMNRKRTDRQRPGYYYKENGYSINITAYPGVSYKIKNNLFLEVALYNLGSLSYGKTNTEELYPGGNVNKGVITSFSFASNISNGAPLQVGMRWIIAKK